MIIHVSLFIIDFLSVTMCPLQRNIDTPLMHFCIPRIIPNRQETHCPRFHYCRLCVISLSSAPLSRHIPDTHKSALRTHVKSPK
ncbi:hypothetical protein XELAEV_18037919mg [Xenopus laevis]|uniref:Secreted protein n=1 Tax=Xenopus laevis TaxID=8355 RepID=A0A974CE94_XENLA|nr:hypothetical protein XELAEV_18037919mg [Xenopus laevis]